MNEAVKTLDGARGALNKAEARLKLVMKSLKSGDAAVFPINSALGLLVDARKRIIHAMSTTWPEPMPIPPPSGKRRR